MRWIILLFFLLLLLTVTSAQEPESISQIREYNLSQAESISILIALIGGIISLLSPCAWPLIPAFLAFALNERKRLFSAGSIFFAGLLIPILALNFGAVFVGNILTDNKDKLILISGVILVVFGLMNVFGKDFGFRLKNKFGRRLNLALIGVAFSIGFTPCVFPITSSIMVISAALNSYFYAGLLTIAYVTGQSIIIFLGIAFFERFKILEKKIFQKEINILGLRVLLIKAISGLLLIFLGVMFLLYGGSSLFNTYDLGTMWIVSAAHEFLINLNISNGLGNVTGIFVIIFLAYLIYKKSSQ